MSRASDLANVIASGSTDIVAEGTATTNLQQGLAKAFEIHNNDSTTVLESINISSITDGDTGICSPVFINNMSSVNYFTAASTGDENANTGYVASVRYTAAATTSTYTYKTVNSAGNASDRANTMSCNHGDLA